MKSGATASHPSIHPLALIPRSHCLGHPGHLRSADASHLGLHCPHRRHRRCQCHHFQGDCLIRMRLRYCPNPVLLPNEDGVLDRLVGAVEPDGAWPMDPRKGCGRVRGGVDDALTWRPRTFANEGRRLSWHSDLVDCSHSRLHLVPIPD